MRTAAWEPRLVEAFNWIVRLPLLGDAELGSLIGIDAIDARHLRSALEERGWVDWIAPGLPGLDEQRHAAFLRIGALPDLAVWSGIDARAIARRAPVRDTELLRRMARIGIVSGVNWLLAKLAEDVRSRGELQLTDACSLPLREAGRWGPAAVDGYGALSRARGTARFFIAWDRAGAPDSRRRERARAWAKSCDPSTDAPTIFLVCADLGAQHFWEHELDDCRNRGASVPDVRLTTADELVDAGPPAPIWTRLGASTAVGFQQQLTWCRENAAPLLRFDMATPLLRRVPTAPRFSVWAQEAAAIVSDAPERERVSALAACTSAADKLCLDWLGRHPRLSAAELAAHLDVPEIVIARQLALLLRYHAVRRLEVDDTTLWCITMRSLQVLASEEGTPWQQFKENAGVTAPEPADDLKTRPSLAHELGINHVFTDLARDANRAGWQLGAWRNGTESTQRFVDANGYTVLKPDGSGTLSHGNAERPFLLEYDRGTLDGGDFAGKFATYRRYYRARAWRAAFGAAPLLLFVCTDPRAERRVVAAVQSRGGTLPFAVTTEWRFRSDPANDAGLFGSIWRGAEDAGDRAPLTSLWGSR